MDSNDDHDAWLDLVESLFRQVASIVSQQRRPSDVAEALDLLTGRCLQTWKTIRSLYRHATHHWDADAAALVRVAFDALIQATYICHDASQSGSRAKDYLDFPTVEKKRQADAMLKCDAALARAIASSPLRPEGEKKLSEAYQRIAPRFTNARGVIRKQWYPGTLRDLAEEVGLGHEYVLLLSLQHGAVHSSASMLRHGPPLDQKNATILISIICGRLLRLTVRECGTDLPNAIDEMLCAVCSDSLLSSDPRLNESRRDVDRK